jgi:hypothetical protein
MNFDLECNVISTATDLFGFALKESASNELQWDQAVELIIREVQERYPDFSAEKLAFAMGRALGRIECQRRIEDLSTC